MLFWPEMRVPREREREKPLNGSNSGHRVFTSNPGVPDLIRSNDSIDRWFLILWSATSRGGSRRYRANFRLHVRGDYPALSNRGGSARINIRFPLRFSGKTLFPTLVNINNKYGNLFAKHWFRFSIKTVQYIEPE